MCFWVSSLFKDNNKKMKQMNKPLTFLLALTFLFLMLISLVIFPHKVNAQAHKVDFAIKITSSGGAADKWIKITSSTRAADKLVCITNADKLEPETLRLLGLID